MKLSFYFQVVLSAIFLVHNVHPNAIQLTSANFDSVVGNSELVFINFYASWCRFSQMLEPIWNELADKIHKTYTPSQVVIGKVDADSEKQVAQSNGINKYPTLKIYRYGVLVKKEYRGARNVEAFEQFIKDQLESKLQTVDTLPAYMAIHNSKSTIIGYFETKNSAYYNQFLKLANILRDRCEFVAAIGDVFKNERHNGVDRIVYKEDFSATDLSNPQNTYSGRMDSYDELYAWTYERCTPTVRKITFENAEELTEGGLPFLILFHKPDDTASIKQFETEVKRQLGHLTNSVLPVAADGLMFSHPLHHLGKSVADLPVVAIDSFKHMYVFPDKNKKYYEGENLKEFIMDLNSGKLHRDFHSGSDQIIQMPNVQFQIVVNEDGHVPKIPEVKPQVQKKNVPESAFVKLAPSQDRYSVRHGDGGEF